VRAPALPPTPAPLTASVRGRYNKLCGYLRGYAHRLARLPAGDPFRARMEGALLGKLYDLGVLGAQGAPSDVENKLTVAAFCRRRLAVVMCAARMAETVSAVRAFCCLRGWTGRGSRACARRPSNLSSRGTSASARTRSQTPPSWSPGLLPSLVSYARFTDTPVRADIWRTL
jgi:hypothetical protein